MRIPLKEVSTSHIQKNPISLHVPGHKGLVKGFLPNAFASILPYDLTEVTGLDDLHAPSGAILEAERLLAETYGADQSFFLVNGSTVGNLAMILATLGRGDQVLVQRNCHKSITNGLALVDANPIYFTDIKIDTSIIMDAVVKFPRIKAVILTYPDYEGFTYDIRAIIEFAHSVGIVVLVDEAHGAHFVLGKPFPISAVEAGADIVVQSAHKTLPAMTMASFLHVKEQNIDPIRVKLYLTMLQSSSPSYLLMLSLDCARAYIADFSSEDVAYTIDQSNRFVTDLNENEEITAFQSNDPLKILVQSRSVTGFQLQKLLEAQAVFTELADEKRVLMILPLLKWGQPFSFIEIIESIKRATDQIRQDGETLEKAKGEAVTVPLSPRVLSELALSFSEMDKLAGKFVSFTSAIGGISSETITPYPPGVPLVLRGEIIQPNTVAELEKLVESGWHFHGGERLTEKQIQVYNI